MSDDQQPADRTRPPRDLDPSDAPTVDGSGDSAFASAPAGPTLEAGQEIGTYRIVRLLGRGGMGEVYEADDRSSGRRVALKILSRALASDNARHRFRKEGRLAATLSHPNCVYVFQAGEVGQNPIIAMELLPQGTLKDRVDAQGPLPYREAVDVILQVIDGLEAAERAGILHRDVKPANCFVAADGSVKVGDFGLSMSTVPTQDTRLTSTGMMLGTPAYASPEQLQGDELDVRSDVYSVGATLYYLLTGQIPLDADNPVKLVAAILQQAPVSPAVHRPELPKPLCSAVLRCLGKKPDERYACYAYLRSALLPHGSRGSTPARWRPRILAGGVDWLMWWLVAMVLQGVGIHLTLGPVLAILAAKVLYWTSFEGIWGASIGKRLVGIRVVDSRGVNPGLRRAALRGGIFELLPNSASLLVHLTWLRGMTGEEVMEFASTGTGVLVGLSGVVLFGLLFVTVRRSNGYAAIHELLSDSRTVMRSAVHERSAVTPLELVASGEPVERATVGPYRVQGALRPDGDARILLARDEQLDRPVWIRQTQEDEPPIQPARRDLNRSGRLRWLNGRREDDESWDAFEAPAGKPLAELIESRQSWSAVRHWLHDLARELQSGLEDGTLPARIGLDHVWIGADGRAWLLDFPVESPGGRNAAASAASTRIDSSDPDALRTFLSQVAQVALEGRLTAESVAGQTPAAPLPLGARTLLTDLNEGRIDLAGLADRLSAVTESRSRIGRGKRLVHVASYSVLLALLPLAVTVSALLLRDAGFIAELEGLAFSLKELGKMRQGLDGCVEDPGDAHVEALEVLIAGRFGHFRPFLSPDGNRGTLNPLTEVKHGMQRGMFDGRMKRTGYRDELSEVLDRTPPTPDELAEAETVLGEEFLSALDDAQNKTGAGRSSDRTLAHALTASWILLTLEWAILVAVAFAFRGGPLMQLLGFAVVTTDGRQASRFRVLLRGVVAIAPVALSILPFSLLVRFGERTGHLWVVFAWGATIGLVVLAGLVWCVLDPARGPHDRVARTFLVPR